MVLLSCLWFVWFQWPIFILSSSEGTTACSLPLRAWIRTYTYQTNKQTKVAYITVTGRSWDQIQVQLRSQCLRDKGWWEKTDALFRMSATWEDGWVLPKPSLSCQLDGKGFHRGKLGPFMVCRQGLHADQHSQLWPSSQNRPCSDLVSIICNLQLQGWFVHIPLRPISDVRQAVDISTAQDGAAYIKATVWSSCS